MPEPIAGGPAIPVRLLNELDSGKVVFFCGAGVSMGPGSDLPDFDDLVRHVYGANRIEPDAVENEALEIGAVDKALGLLERDDRLGARAVRRTVIERLSEPPSGELSVHKALIDLSRNEKGVRLITTNFDDRSVEAGLEEELVDAAPKLPLRKPDSWSSLVHLHGRIVPNENGANLVLTAADFGRTYPLDQVHVLWRKSSPISGVSAACDTQNGVPSDIRRVHLALRSSPVDSCPSGIGEADRAGAPEFVAFLVELGSGVQAVGGCFVNSR